jgi:hypothetical protein
MTTITVNDGMQIYYKDWGTAAPLFNGTSVGRAESSEQDSGQLNQWSGESFTENHRRSHV